MKEFSQEIINFINKEFPDKAGVDFEQMSLDDLIQFRQMVTYKRQEYALLENSMKVANNASYGASGNEHFYWYRPELASAITGEAREAEATQWKEFPNFMKETIWERKDLWEQFDFVLDESMHQWIREQKICVQGDTDSTYGSWAPLFKCMTNESQKRYDTDEKKLNFILRFYKEFLNKEQNRWIGDKINARHGKSVQEFELELVCKSLIGLAKKKYVKGVVWEKGHFMVDHPKLKSTGVEIVKSTTPALCRKFLKEIVDELLYKYDEDHKEEFIFTFNNRLAEMYREFKSAPIDDISNSVGVGDYKKYVLNDKEKLEFAPRAPFSVKAAARYNHLANIAGRADLKIMSGKIKYYNIKVGRNDDYFGFPAGECPDFAPPIDYGIQWRKNVIDPVNRFLTAMNIPNIGPTNRIQASLFGW